jgi:iron complex transport system permease protein
VDPLVLPSTADALAGAAVSQPSASLQLGRYSPQRLIGLLVIGVGLLVGVALVAALFGGIPLHLGAALENVGTDGTIFWKLRLPRVLLGAVVGAGLCAAGAALQALLQNPLADPFVLGVSGGAAAGATAALLVGELLGARFGTWNQGALGFSPQVVFGFGGALLSAFLVRAVGSRSGRLVGAAALLAGAVINAVAGALVLLAQVALSPDRAQQILLWLAGSLGYPPPSTLWVAAICVTGGCAGLCLLAGRIRLLALGNDAAAQLGIDVANTARWTLALTSLVVAAAVAVSGLIGFVGLLVPHLLRMRLGPDQRLLLPASVFGGAILLVAADAAGRLAFLPLGIEPPVGALTALLGGPLFLVLLRRSLRSVA